MLHPFEFEAHIFSIIFLCLTRQKKLCPGMGLRVKSQLSVVMYVSNPSTWEEKDQETEGELRLYSETLL